MPTPRALTLAAALTTLAALPATAEATDGISRRPVVRHDAERLEVVVPASDTAHQRITLEDVLDGDVMAYHFSVEAVDGSGATVRLPVAFAFFVGVEGVGTSSRIRLTGTERELILPRPLGVRVPRTARLDLHLQAAGADMEGIALRLVIQHERDGLAGSRIPVKSTDLSAIQTASEAASWEWTAPERGRLLAINGLPLERLDGVELRDAATGEVLWSTALRGNATGATASHVLRMGVPVAAGRTYRLTARGVAGASRELVALVLPTPPIVASAESAR